LVREDWKMTDMQIKKPEPTKSLADNNKFVCRKCMVEMRPGKAIENTLTGAPEFIDGPPIVTMSSGGPGKLIDCLKCLECGWSIYTGNGN
jgi:hypothetical protein